MLNVEF